MTTARLSPAATLLRNSRLFALPRAISGPIPQPSAETVSSSDTATTPWPLRAAIETPFDSQLVGDWGLKRSLPLKSTGKTGTSFIRIQRGVDTGEHITDFESAADHVITLRKWQELNLPVMLPKPSNFNQSAASNVSTFSPLHDNITQASSLGVRARSKQPNTNTNIWPDVELEVLENQLPTALRDAAKRAKKTQMLAKEAEEERQRGEHGYFERESQLGREKTFKKYRWRHDGPWLAGLTETQFDAWLTKAMRNNKDAFRAMIKEQMRADKKTAAKDTALQLGRTFDEAALDADLEVTENDVTNYLRRLRTRPEIFGPLIAQFFDLPEGPLRNTQVGLWPYGRQTVSAASYPQSGLPATHPSAGLSYVHSATFAHNDHEEGPKSTNAAVIGRVLKSRKAVRATGTNSYDHSVGVAGFVAGSYTPGSYDKSIVGEFAPEKGGRKIPVRPIGATINSDGHVALKYAEDPNYSIVDGHSVVPRSKVVARMEPAVSKEASRDRDIPQLDGWRSRQPARSKFRQTLADKAGISERLDQMVRRDEWKEQGKLSSAGLAIVDEMSATFR